MTDSVLLQQLGEVLDLLNRTRDLFGANPVEPPPDIAPDPAAAQQWVY